MWQRRVFDLKNTQSLKLNRDFRRLYSRGKTAAGGFVVVYCRPNRYHFNRVGFTVGKSVGKDQRENKLTFPALYGEEKAAAMLQECTENARAALEPFGEGAEFLCEMAARMAVRDH